MSGTDAMFVKRIVIVFLAALAAVCSHAETTDIYQPRVLVAGVKDHERIDSNLGTWGFGIGQVAQENLPANMAFNFSGRYFAGERWYLLAALQMAEFSDRVINDNNGDVLVKQDVTSVLATTGLGYQLLQGSASFSGQTTYPWQLGVEGYLGEQYTGDSSGRYLGVGVSWQLMFGQRWLALEWKNFQIDDDNLQQADVSKGIQWGLSFGSFY
jgi:hypothetical protein